MANSIIIVTLDSSNTIVNNNPVQYNVNVTLNLSPSWAYITSSQNNFNRLFVQTTLNIPIINNNIKMYADLSLINYYDIDKINNKEIKQYGYYEGDYDDTRDIGTYSSVWCYELIPSS